MKMVDDDDGGDAVGAWLVVLVIFNLHLNFMFTLEGFLKAGKLEITLITSCALRRFMHLASERASERQVVRSFIHLVR